MAAFDEKILVWIVAGVISYIIYRKFFSEQRPAATAYDTQINEILTSDKYKVKGRFED